MARRERGRAAPPPALKQDPGPDGGREQGRTILLAALVSGVALRLWLATRNAGLTMDSPLYVYMAEALARGQPAPGPAHHGYSALLALAHLILPGRELPGRAVSFVAGVALIPLTYLLARRLAPGWLAGLAAGLVAIHPLLAVYSGPIMTETAFAVLVLGALLLIDRGQRLAGGVGLGLAYTVRPEAIVVAIGASILGRPGLRNVLRLVAGFAIVAGPYVGYLSWERGEFSLSPKSVLVRPSPATRAEAEWRVGDPPARETGGAAGGEIALRIIRQYPTNLLRHLGRLIESWPWPLLALSVAGLVTRPGPPAAPLLSLLVLPLLAVAPEARFSLPLIPVLAVYLAAGAAWCEMRWRGPRLWWAALVLLAAMAGLAWSWSGRVGRLALHFDDGPMAQMREAGEWLGRYGRPGATVMDRKAYVPFYAGMRHVQLPNDDYETIMRYAQTSGADYLVLEEFVVQTMRPQLLPLIADARFRARESRLRTLHHVRAGPHTGVAVMEILRDTTAAGPGPSP